MAYQVVVTGRGKRVSNGTLPTRSLPWARPSWTRVVILIGLALLLGRADIEQVISPFAIAFFVIVVELLGVKRSWPAAAALVGAFTRGGLGAASLLGVEMVVYLLCRRALFARRAPDLHWAPFIAATIDVIARLAAVGTVWTRYDLMISFADGALVAILALIFIQCIPIFTGELGGRTLRFDQWVSISILLGSVITGLASWTVAGVSVAGVVIDWLVLLMAAAGGPGVATTTAVVTGTLSVVHHTTGLADVAVLAFSGLLAGVLKDAGRLWGGLAFVGSTALLSTATANSFAAVEASALAGGIGCILYFFTPRRLRRELAACVPGTQEHRESEQDRARRVRKLLWERVDGLGQVFEELSNTFAAGGVSSVTSAHQLMDHAVGRVATTVCHACPRREKCWGKESFQTYQAIVHTLERLEATGSRFEPPTPDLRERCVRMDAMMSMLRQNLEIIDRDAKWLNKLNEQRQLVSQQLAGVAEVIRSVASEIDRRNESTLWREEQILAAIEQMGLYVDDVHIVSLDPGRVEVEVTQPSQGAHENSVRVIAPLLSGIVGENITVHEVCGGPGSCRVVFRSARLFDVRTAVATVARDGRTVSGDSCTALDIGNRRFAVAVSDGMGNGERAQRESKAAIDLLTRLLQAGFDEQLAVRTVNSALLLRSREEVFTTLDMALIDLYSARAEFLKIGSAPSFIKRGNDVITIRGDSIPIGILRDIEVQSIVEQLQAGDILILVSDGVYDAPHRTYDQDEWLKRQIAQLETSDPQAIADTLLECAVRFNHGEIRDDMTVMVAAVEAHKPEWAAISIPHIAGLRQQRRRGA
ncbi:stage II sporulation protein E [Alicyclobacillus sp.]|uniref:stage II sporulation protein E n=1 Tax=Alicyclobacillus sp. TaxID=61169 RepID=UPI0025C6C1E7|nr:stage II sporulation protein E [Alicyclobacillus sp.]MCL6517382.1 stage II sporulation protein E [Alicyclobacillus sp.]